MIVAENSAGRQTLWCRCAQDTASVSLFSDEEGGYVQRPQSTAIGEREGGIEPFAVADSDCISMCRFVVDRLSHRRCSCISVSLAIS